MPTTSTNKIAVRFWKKVNKNGPIPSHASNLGKCWLWTASKLDRGYGQFVANRRERRTSAHRYCWTMTHGHIPEGMNVLHKCDNPSCVRPSHLFLGTLSDNTQDMYRKGREKPGWVPGEMNGRHKLTERDVLEIRRRFIPRCRKNGRKALSIEFGVSDVMIGNIITRQNWSHI